MLTLDQLNNILNTLRSAGWSIKTKLSPKLELRPEVQKRYPNIPADYELFLSHVAVCANPKSDAWFLTESDFNAGEDAESAFRWNEWELISLEAAEGDPEQVDQIAEFWRTHLPIMASVNSDYAYLALALSEPGAPIVYGYGTEFEESATVVAPSFSEFLEQFAVLASNASNATDKPSSNFGFRDFL